MSHTEYLTVTVPGQEKTNNKGMPPIPHFTGTTHVYTRCCRGSIAGSEGWRQLRASLLTVSRYDRGRRNSEGRTLAKGRRRDPCLRTHLSFIFYISSHVESISQTGLFSVAVTALIAVTVQDLKEDPQDRSAFYLENLYTLQFSNDTRPSSPAQFPPFSVPLVTNAVNACLLMSLSLNILAALFSLFVQRATRQYLFITHSPRSSSDYRARLREAFVNDFQNSPISWAVWASIISLFISTGFFFLGLLLYLNKLDPNVYDSVYICVGVCVAIYFSIVFMPIERRSAFYLSLFSFFIPSSLMFKFRLWRSTKDIDDRVLARLFKAVIKDSDLVRFFESIPGFCKSSLVDKPRHMITKLGHEKLHTAVKGLLERTWSSGSLPKSDKARRLAACVKVADATPLPNAMLSILEDIFPHDAHAALRSVELGQFLKNQGNSKPDEIGLCAQIIIAGIISHVQESDDEWVALAANQLGKSETVIRGYLERGNDDVLLANLTHITRQIFHSLKDNRDMAVASSSILRSLSEFGVRNTLPELQRDFLALWKEIGEAPDDNVVTEIRDSLFNIYNTLTQGTVEASTPTTSPNPSDSTSPVHGLVDENAQIHCITSPSEAPISYQSPSLTTSSPKSLSPTPGHIAIALADESSLGSIPEVTLCPTAASTSSGPIPSPRGSQGLSGISQAVGSAATAKTGNIAVPSITAEVASIFGPHITSTASVIAHRDAQDMNDQVEMNSLPRTRQLDLSAPDTPA